MTKALYFYSAARGKAPYAVLTAIENGRRVELERFNVMNKREARAIAKDLSATPWNF